MKGITKYIVAGYALAFLFACEKPKTHTYSGRLLHSCENPTPVAHQKIYLVHDNFPALWNTDQYGVIAETETDSAGYFTFTFEEITKKGYLNIQRDKVNYRLAGWGLSSTISQRFDCLLRTAHLCKCACKHLKPTING